jgi:hypothetical protein
MTYVIADMSATGQCLATHCTTGGKITRFTAPHLHVHVKHKKAIHIILHMYVHNSNHGFIQDLSFGGIIKDWVWGHTPPHPPEFWKFKGFQTAHNPFRRYD